MMDISLEDTTMMDISLEDTTMMDAEMLLDAFIDMENDHPRELPDVTPPPVEIFPDTGVGDVTGFANRDYFRYREYVDAAQTYLDERAYINADRGERAEIVEHILYRRVRIMYEEMLWRVHNIVHNRLEEEWNRGRSCLLRVFHRGQRRRVLPWGGPEGTYGRRNGLFRPWFEGYITRKMTNGLHIWELTDANWSAGDRWRLRTTDRQLTPEESRWMFEVISYFDWMRRRDPHIRQRHYASAGVIAGVIFGAPFKCRRRRLPQININLNAQDIEDRLRNRFCTEAHLECDYSCNHESCHRICRGRDEIDHSIIQLLEQKLALMYAIPDDMR